MQANLTLKRALLLVTILSICKQYMEDYWLSYSQYCEGRWLILILLQFWWDWTMEGTFYAIVYWAMMIIVHLIFFLNMSFIIIFLTNFESVICCHFCQNWLESVKELHKVLASISIYISIKKITIPFSSNQQTVTSEAIACVKKSITETILIKFKPSVSG